MADTAAAPAASKPDTSEAKQQFVRPEKPDETVYKDQLSKLEKAHADSQAKFVSNGYPQHPSCHLAVTFFIVVRRVRLLESHHLQVPAANICSPADATSILDVCLLL